VLFSGGFPGLDFQTGEHKSPLVPAKAVILSEAEGSAVAFPRSLGGPGSWSKIQAMREGGYFTYIVASRSHTLYVGVTRDLHKRIFEHKWKDHEGFTARYNCDRLVWFENFGQVSDAIAREKQLKGWRREKKIVLIEKTNPTWQDLSWDWYEYEPADFKRATDRMDT